MAVKRAIIEYIERASKLEDACIIYKPRSDFIIGSTLGVLWGIVGVLKSILGDFRQNKLLVKQQF